MAAKTAGTWRAYEPIGIADMTNVDATAVYEVGKRCKARDVGATAYGFGEFIYLKGVASTVRGSLVVIGDDYSTSLSATRSKGALAVALAITDSTSKWGWYQILGTGVITCGTVAANLPAYLVGSTGTIDDAVLAGDVIAGMRTKTADDTGTCVVTMACYPSTVDGDNA